MPNITGQTTAGVATDAMNDAGSSIYRVDGTVSHKPPNWQSSKSQKVTYKLDASISSSIYGNSNTVTPLSQKTNFIIKY